jgi:hypothetical protein
VTREATKERLTELQEQLTVGVEKLVSSDEWMRMLNMAAKMPRYSMNNLLLIAIQHPTAEYVCGFNTWKKLDRSVVKGQKAIWILGPVKRRLTLEDKDSGEEVKVQKLVGFKPVAVFAQDQTEGEPLPDVGPKAFGGDAPRAAWDGIVRELEKDGYRVLIEAPHTFGAEGETDPVAKVVRIDPSRSPAMQLATLLHEQAHVRLGHVDDVAAYRQHRGVMEVEAESVAYVVAGALGLDTSAYSVGYLGGWSRGDVDLIRKTADRVVSTAHGIVNAIAPETGIEVAQETGMEVGAEL